jgi:3,4-dihydroxy 2-butanone 4-phosphate synthase / GTP cyclohydrolase II
MTISSIPEIIAEIQAGRMVILVDEEDRENEGDLVMAAEFATPAAINFMAKYGRGLICLTLTEERCRQLNLPPMVSNNRSQMGTNFTVSIEAAHGVTTGISAADRARTVHAAVKRDARPEDIVQPGHIFPLMAQRGGVLVRAGHTEAGCDLAQLAGMTPAAVICEVLKDDGEMARLPDLLAFAEQHALKVGAIADLIHYRSRTESLITRVAERPMETAYGRFRLYAYRDTTADQVHLALVKGDVVPGVETLVRVHEPLSVIDLLDAASTAHSWNLNAALSAVAAAPSGVVVLLHRSETGEDVLSSLSGQESPDPPKPDLRNYGIGAQILKDLGVSKMKLMAVPRKMPSMAGFDLEVTGYVLPQQERPAARVASLKDRKRER